MLHPDLHTLAHEDELHRLIDESQTRPVLLFKHSRTCGTSMDALDELLDHLNERPSDVAARYAMVTVQTHREVSNAVAKRLGIRHETPQALLVRAGRVVWSASHFRVTASAVDAALKVNDALKAQS